MISATKKILEDALALPEKEREALVETLSDSLSPETVELSLEGTSEIRNRIAQIESGEAKTIPWDEVDARIRKSHHAVSDLVVNIWSTSR